MKLIITYQEIYIIKYLKSGVLVYIWNVRKTEHSAFFKGEKPLVYHLSDEMGSRKKGYTIQHRRRKKGVVF